MHRQSPVRLEDVRNWIRKPITHPDNLPSGFPDNIACGISGQIQHTAGMDGSAMVISINTDPEAPINKIADYAITGDVNEVIPKMIKYYKQNSK